MDEKTKVFEQMHPLKALAVMAVPSVISQLIPLIAYNYSARNTRRMKQVFNWARIMGIGAAISAVAYPYNEQAAMIAGISAVIVLRVLAARYKWHLPKA